MFGRTSVEVNGVGLARSPNRDAAAPEPFQGVGERQAAPSGCAAPILASYAAKLSAYLLDTYRGNAFLDRNCDAVGKAKAGN